MWKIVRQIAYHFFRRKNKQITINNFAASPKLAVKAVSGKKQLQHTFQNKNKTLFIKRIPKCQNTVQLNKKQKSTKRPLKLPQEKTSSSLENGGDHKFFENP
jgi:uncharacterized protein YlxW (UPF0749 family)